LFTGRWLFIAIFDTFDDDTAGMCDPLQQFHGISFEQSSLAELPPRGLGRIGGIAHSSLMEPEFIETPLLNLASPFRFVPCGYFLPQDAKPAQSILYSLIFRRRSAVVQRELILPFV
jgi:hypothetical protein